MTTRKQENKDTKKQQKITTPNATVGQVLPCNQLAKVGQNKTLPRILCARNDSTSLAMILGTLRLLIEWNTRNQKEKAK